jgi:hypothetical protein
MNEEQIKAKAGQLYRHTFAGLLEEGEETPNIIIEPYLYLGNVNDAHNIDKLIAKNLTNIINVADPAQEEGKEDPNAPFSGGVVYRPHAHRIKINYSGFRCHDLEDFNMRRVFDKTYEIIKSVKERGERVLVHCQAGVSRSASVICAYLMREYNWTAEKAVLHTHQMRRCTSPNLGFMQQLLKYQIELGIPTTEELLPMPPRQ